MDREGEGLRLNEEERKETTAGGRGVRGEVWAREVNCSVSVQGGLANTLAKPCSPGLLPASDVGTSVAAGVLGLLWIFIAVFVGISYCCVNVYYQRSNFKPHTFMISASMGQESGCV